jgi:anti-sigma factor RsiW
MICSRVQELLPDYSVELLSNREQQAVKAHLDGCPACSTELHAMESVVALVETYGVRQPPPGLFNAVRNRIEAGDVRQQRPFWWAFFSSGPARTAALGTAMAAVALGLVLPTGPNTALPPQPGLHTVIGGGMSASGELGGSIRRHALSAAEGPLADRVAWEAMVQLAEYPQGERGGAD